MLFLLLAVADPDTAVEAERAFARAAQARGQWTAFREFMTDDAIMFTPQPVKAKDSLPTTNPPIAVQWWPAESYVACNGTAAINTGPWVRPRSSGYFTTVWLKQPNGGWKWALDHGDTLAEPRALPTNPVVRSASCQGKPTPAPRFGYREGSSGDGASSDGTLAWHWHVSGSGARIFLVWLWDGRKLLPIIENRIAAPPK